MIKQENIGCRKKRLTIKTFSETFQENFVLEYFYETGMEKSKTNKDASGVLSLFQSYPVKIFNLKGLNLMTKINRYLLRFFVKESVLMNPEIKLCRIHLIFLKFVVKVVDNYSKVKVEHLKSL